METAVNSRALKLLVVDDHVLLCEALAASLGADEGIQVDSASSVDEARAKISEYGRYDVVLLDYSVPGTDNLEGMRQLIEANGGSVALFSGVASWSVVERAIDAGASGFIPKSVPLKTFGHAVRFIADGECYLPADYMMRAARKDDSATGLKPRERRVLGLLCVGMQNREIGRELGLEETTVKLDVKSICRKLGAGNRTQAVIEAFKQGMY